MEFLARPMPKQTSN